MGRIGRRALLTRSLGIGAGLAFAPTLADLGLADGALRGSQITVFADANPQGESVEKLLPEFESATGIKVNYQILSESVITKKATVELAAGNGSLDVTWGGLSDVPAWVRAGWLAPIDDYLGDARIVGSRFDPSDFVPATWKAMEIGGKRYGLPVFIGTKMMYYRRDVFQAHGIQAPDTAADLLQACKRINGPELPAIALRGARGVHANLWTFNTFSYAEGGRYYKHLPDNLAPTLNDPGNVKALDIFVQLFRNYSPSGAVNFNFPEVVASMSQGHVAMIIDGAPLGPLLLNPEKSTVADKLGVALVPKGPAGRYPGFDAQMWVLAKGSRNKEAGAAFMAWSTSPQVQLKAALNGNFVAPTRISVWNNPGFKKTYAFLNGHYLEVFRRTLDYLTPDFFPRTPSFNVIGDYASIAVSQAISGQASPQSALDQAQVQAEQYAKQNHLVK